MVPHRIELISILEKSPTTHPKRVCLLTGITVVDRSRAGCWRSLAARKSCSSLLLLLSRSNLVWRVYTQVISPYVLLRSKEANEDFVPQGSEHVRTELGRSGGTREVAQKRLNPFTTFCIKCEFVVMWRSFPRRPTPFQAQPRRCCIVFFSAPVDLHRFLLVECWWCGEGPFHPSPASRGVSGACSLVFSSWKRFSDVHFDVFLPALSVVCLQRVAQVPVLPVLRVRGSPAQRGTTVDSSIMTASSGKRHSLLNETKEQLVEKTAFFL